MKKRFLIPVSIAILSAIPTFAFAQTNGSSSFVPLSNIPAITTFGSSASLPNFLNSLYYICIGIAVVLTVLQLIRAGITYMTASGSIGSTEQAKHLIGASLLGLILVLSPYIVFNIINPNILSLKIDVSKIQTNGTVNPQENGNPGNTSEGGKGSETTGNSTDAPSGSGTSNTTDNSTGAQVPKPSNVQVTNQGSGKASVAWTAPSGGTPPASYRVQVDGQEKAQASGTSVTISGLSEGNHTFTVTAVDAAGNVSPTSDAKSVEITAAAPSGADGSEGSWVYAEWRDHRNESCSSGYKCSTACYVYVETSYPVPYEGRDKATMQQGCMNSLQSDQQAGQSETYKNSFYTCTFLAPEQSLSRPTAPGPVCPSGAP